MSLFTPPPDIPRIPGDKRTLAPHYRYWRFRQLLITFVAYAVYYFVRKNFSVAMPLIEKDLGITKSSLGIFLTLHGVLYGTSKFLNGILADRCNPRFFLGLGLLASALLNLAFGFTKLAVVMGILWCLNGWFQGMGFPPCARVLSHWFSPKERGVMWGIWNSSHMVGAALILVWAGYLGQHYGWRWCFWGPALVAIVVAVLICIFLRDTPGSLGLAPVEFYTGEADQEKSDKPHDSAEHKTFLKEMVFKNKFIWFICLANFFVYVVRYGFLDWAPTYLHEVKEVPLMQAGGMTAFFEFAGLAGSLAAGFVTDRFTRGRRAPICVLYMVGTAIAIVAFWKVPQGQLKLDFFTLTAVGFLIYGPQFLVGVMTADIATKRAAATAIGLTGFFGYLSTVVSGWGLGTIVERYGWDGGFAMLTVCAVLSAFFFALCWNTRPTEE